MAGDKFDQLYNALKADGAVSGTREHFRQFVYAPGKQGYHNRKQLYDALHADGAVSSNSYEEFAQRLGLHAVNPKPQQQKPVQPVKKQTMKQRAQEVAQEYQQTHQPTDYLHRPQNQMGRARRNAPGKASPFVQSLYEIDNAQKGPDYSVDYTSPKATQQVYQQNQQLRRQAAKTAGDHIVNDEYRRQSQSMIDNGTVGVMKPMGEIEQEMSDSASRFVDANLGDYINKAVLGEQNAAGKRAVDAYNNSFAAGGGGGGGINDLLMRSLAYNEENDPDKMIENLAKNARGGLEKLFQNPSFVAKVKNEADMLGVTPEAYVESMLPHLKDRLSAALEKSEYNKYLPKDAFENMTNRFIDSNTIGKLVRGATMTRGQRIMQERASAATAAGENPYYKGSTVENVVADVAGMVSDPVFKGAAGAGGKVAGKLIGNSTKLSALMANGNLAQRLMAKGAQVVTSGGVTGFVFDSTGSVIQNYSTGEDTSLGNTLKVAAKGGTTGAVNFATMSLAGIPLSEVGRSIGLKAVKGGSFWGNTGRATAKIGLESGKTYMEAMGMYLGGYVSGKLEGRTDANGKPIEFDLWSGTMESLPTAIGFRLQHAVEGLKGGRKNEKGEDMGWAASTLANFREFLTSDKAKVSKFMMSEEEKKQIMDSFDDTNAATLFHNVYGAAKNSKTRLKTTDGIFEKPYVPEPTKYEDVERDLEGVRTVYDKIMADPNVSWDAKAKFSAMVMGIMPSARPKMDFVGFSTGYVDNVQHKYVDEYSDKGELLSRREYKNISEREAVIYKLKANAENVRLRNAVALVAGIDKNNYELQNAFFQMKVNRGANANDVIEGLKTPGSEIDKEFSEYAMNMGNVNRSLEFVADNFNKSVDWVLYAFEKDPMYRNDDQQKAAVLLRRSLENTAFPNGKVHAEQSNLNGKDVAEDNNLGTEQPNGDAVKQELNGLRQAEEEVEVLMRDNDVFSQNFKKLQSQGLTNPQIYEWMVQQGGLTVEQLEPFAHYINANARVQGMQEATKQNIENVASSFVQDWSYRDRLNGVGMMNADGSAETVLFVYHDGKELIVGSGDVSFNQPNEYGIRRAKEDVGDMLVCFDPQTGQMVYVHASEVDYSREMKPEELKAQKILELQNINSVPYNEAAQEQAMLDAAKPQQEQEAPQDNTTNEENNTTSGENNTASGENNTKTEEFVPQEQPQQKDYRDKLADLGIIGKYESPVGGIKNNPENRSESRLTKAQETLIEKKVERVLENPNSTIANLHDAIVFKLNNGDRSSANITVLDAIYKVFDAYKRGEISKEDVLNFVKEQFIGEEDNPLRVALEAKREKSGVSPQEQPQQGGEGMRLEDGTPVPFDANGEPDFLKMTPEQGAEVYKMLFEEDAPMQIDSDIKTLEKDLEKVKASKYEGASVMERAAARRKVKEAIALAEAQVERAKAIKAAMEKKPENTGVGTVENAGQYEKERQQGYREGDGGVIYHRQKPEEVGGVRGKEVTVAFSPTEKVKGHVKLVELDTVQASHNNGQLNLLHFGPDWQPKDRSSQASRVEAEKIAGNIDPEQITGSNNAFIGSAPSVNERHETIQGNNRVDALKEMYASHPDQAAKYKQWLIDHAAEFGFNAEDIKKMNKPVIVNELPVDDATAKKLGQMMASGFESGGKRIPEVSATINKLGDKMENLANVLLAEGTLGEDAKLSDLINQNSNRALEFLNRNGFIDNTEYENLATDVVTRRQWLESVLKASLFDGNRKTEAAFNTLPGNAQKAVLATFMRDRNSKAEDRIKENIQKSFEAYNELNQIAGFKNAKNIEQARAAIQAELLNGSNNVFGEASIREKYTNFELELAALYKGLKDQKSLTGLFGKFYDAVQGKVGKELDAFSQENAEPLSKDEAIEKVFGINNKQDYDRRRETESPSESGGEDGAEPAGDRPAGSEPEPAVKVNKALKKIATEITMQTGIEVVTDEKEAQKTLDEAESNGFAVKKQAMLSGLTKAAKSIKSWIKDGKRGKVFTIELPSSTQAMIKKVMGRDFDSHNITANGVAHAVKNHGVNGRKLTENSIPLRNEDLELLPYIMTAPDYVMEGSTDVTSRRSIRFYKELSNGYVVVAEKEYRNSPDDMETITMWAEKSDKATNAQRNAAPGTHVQNAILDIDAAKIRKDAEIAIENDVKIRKQKVYHGTGVNFDAFDSSHAFEGAGSESFGHGVYVTNSEEIGKSYAERAKSKLLPKKIKDLFGSDNKDLISDFLGVLRSDLSNFNAAKSYVLNEVKRQIENAYFNISNQKDFLKNLLSKEDLAERIKPLEDRVNKLEDLKGKLEIIEKSDIEDIKGYRYDVDIPDDNGRNYLVWDKEYSPKEADTLLEKLFDAALGNDRYQEAVSDFSNWLVDEEVRKSDFFDTITGESIYRKLAESFGSTFDGEMSDNKGDAEASFLLSKAGITGMKYKAGTIHGGAKDSDYNYVIYKDSDAKITGSTKFFRSANGEVYGFTVGGKIYLDTKKMEPETPLHEYTHLWTEALRSTNPKEWENVKSLFDGVEELKDEVQKLYPELKGDALYEEMIATFSGREGAKKLEETVRNLAQQEGKSVEESAKATGFLGKVKEALQRYWKGVADMLHIHFTSAEEVADKVLADWASGFNPKDKEREGELPRAEEEDKPNSAGFTPKEIRDHQEKLDRAKEKYVNALKEAKSEKEIKAAEDEFEFTYKDHQNMTGVLDEASVADMWKKELKSAKDSVKKDSKEPSADPMEGIKQAADAFHEEQKQKGEFAMNLKIGKARQDYAAAKESGDAERTTKAANELKHLLDDRLKQEGKGLAERQKIIAEEIGKAEADIIDKPWEQMDLEEREAVSSKNPLTESEINELTSEENKELIPSALAYLRGDKGNIINAISYFKIWNDVRNRHENVSGNSGTENGTQLDAADTTGGEGLGLGRGRESGRPDGPVDRGAGNEAAPGERNGREGDQNDTTLSAGEQGNNQGEGNSSGVGAVPAGSSDTNGGGSASGNGHVSGGSGRESSKRPADTNAGRKPTAKQGTTFPDSTAERLKQERADYEKKKKDFWDRWKKAGQGYAKIALTPFKKLNLTPEQIEMLPELVKMHLNGAVLKIKEGIYKFNEWKAAMLAEEGEELKMIGLSDDDIDRFIEDYWNTPYEMDGETHTIREWSSIYGNQQLKKKLKEPLEEKYKRQMEAEPIEVKVGDMKNIEETLPYLLPQQQEDVLKAETQFFGKEHTDREHAYGKGYLFTNGTGTGKTYTGLGIAKRLAKQGKGRILFITPSQKKVSDWIKDGKNLGLDIKDLDYWAKMRGTTATTESGEGMVITTFANFGLNKKLLETEWDAVIYDECHRIMENKKGTETARSMQHYMVTNRDENHCFRRLQSINPEYQKMNGAAEKFDALRLKEIDRIKKEYKNSHPSATNRDVDNATLKSLPRDLNSFAPADGMTFPKLGKAYQDFIKARDAYNKVEPKLKEQAKDSWKNTKTIFLSATPFNTRENLDYVEGYIFKYPETDERGMGGRTQFYLNHFGAAYKFRYHRLEQSISNPDAVAKQEVAFSDYLQNTLGTMSGRIIDSPYDYSRDFPTVAPDHAEDFNHAVQDTLKTKYLHDAYSKTIGDYNYGSALFETMKVSAAIDRIKQHLDLGRKVVIFHRRVESKEPLEAPFAYMLRVANEQIKMMKPGKERDEYIKECTEFRNKYADLLEWEKTLDYSMPREQISKVFGEKNVLFFSGKESKKVKDKAIDTFNDDDSGKNIIVIQEASGKEGISLHDTTSKHQRVCITLALPQSPITALQIEGRIYRIGNMSNAIFEYPILGLNSEMMLFGEKFNNQVSTTENLALGSQARNLRDSFAKGILEHSGIVPVENQGVGGKEFDAATPSENDPFDNAVLDYYSNQKLNKNNREGSDYFPTPEPLGYKMVEWAGLGEGDSVLEPSAGHGAIARYVPKTNEMVSIEPSQSLFTKLQLRAGGLGRKFMNNTFENYALNNKHDVIVMNPPFGKAGALAIQHVDKAFKHLDEGGRIVAIIPRGSTDKKFDKWYNEQNNVAMRAEVNLPDILFQQAGTRVACRVVVLDKISDAALRSKAGYPEKIDLSGHYDKIEDFFNDLRDIEMPDRIIDTNLKMQKKAKAAVKDIMEIKGVKNVSYGKTGINVSLTGSWMNYGISFTGSDKPNYWRDKMANYYTKYDELQKLEYQENKQAVFDELKKLSCKLAGMTEDEMQRYISNRQENGKTHFRIEENAENEGSSEKLFLSLQEKSNNKKEYNETVTELANRVKQGTARIAGEIEEGSRRGSSPNYGGLPAIAGKILNGAYKQGRGQSGEMAGGASELQGGEVYPINEIHARIEEWAKENNCYYTEADIAKDSLDGEMWNSGSEAYVYRSKDGKSVIKAISYDSYYKNPVDYYLDRNRYFNEVFPDSAIEVMGYGRDNNGKPTIFYKQPLIEGETVIDHFNGDELKANEYVDNMLANMGYDKKVPHDKWGCMSDSNGKLNVFDANYNNVIIDKDGKPHVIDAEVLPVDYKNDGNIEIKDNDSETHFRNDNDSPVSISKDAPAVVKHIAKVAKATGGKVKMLQSVEEVTNTEAKARLKKGEKVEGWYDESTGEVVLYMPNVHDSYTAEKTVWHEIVGHKGMRELFGNDNYDKFLDDIYFNLDKPEYADLKKLVMKELQYNPFNYRNAIEEAIARMAEEGHGEQGLWNNLKNKVTNIFREIGYRVAPNTKDIKYLLWLAKNYSKHPESDGYFAIRRNALLHKLEKDNTPSIVERNGMYFDNDGKNHDYLLDLNHKDFEEATDGKVHFRTSPMTASKIEEYNRRLGTKLYAFKESTVDHMQSLQEAMEIISGEKNAWTDIPSAFNPLQAQNRIDSIVQQKAEEYDRKYTKPLDDSFKKVVSTMSGSDKDEQLRNAQLYMITKHGLERNRVFFVRDAIRDMMNDDVTKTKTLMKDWNDKQKDLADELEKGNIRFDEYLEQMDEWIRSNVDVNFVADEHDYSGFHGMQNIAKTSDPYDDKLAIDNVMSAESQIGSDLVKDFWTKKKAATDYVIDQEYYNGFIDNSDRDYLKGMFQWYVPLRKFDDTTAEDVYGYIGEKGDPSNFVGPVLANAKGRSSLSDINVMAQISAMAKSSLINGGKNVVKQHFARFVSAYETGNTKDKIFVEVNPWLEKHVVDGNEVWEEVTPQIPENATQQQISNILQNFEDTMQAKKATGDAKLSRINPNIGFKFQRAKDKSEHIIDVYIAGKKRSFVCQGNPRAAQALNGLVKDSGTRNVATRFDAKITRKIAQFNTSLNPDFMMSNMLRDLTFASANVTKEGFAYTKDFLKEYAGNIISIKNGKGSGNYLTMFRKYRDGKLDINNERERMFKEFMDNGGQTGFVQIKKLESLIDEYDNLIKKGSKDADGWFVKKIKEGGTFIETANEIIENVARYSTYCTSRKHGRSVGRSIYDAKEVSTNFNRHGSGDAIRKLKTSTDSNIDKIFRRSLGFFNSWMKNHTQFYNAGVQGANLFFKNYKSAWKTTAVSFGMLPLGLGIAQALINQFLINNEDEKDRNGVKDPYAELPEWKRRNNICIYTGHGNFKTIPIAIELRAFFGLGDIAAGYVVNDKLKSSTPIGYDILGQMAQLVPASDFLGHHSPSSSIKELGEDALLAVTPTTISPAMELGFNRDWTGRPFYRDYDYLDKAPRWKRAYDNTNDIYMSINKWANQGTNGIDSSNADMKGNETLDYLTAPYAWQHLIDSYTGGMGSTIGRTYKTLEAIGKGVVSGAKNEEGFSKGFSDEFEKFDKNQIPLYRVFNYTPKEGQDMQRTRSKWYNYSDELKQTEYNIKQLKTNTPDVLKNMENNAKKFNFIHGEEGKAYNIWNAADNYIQNKKKILKRVSDPEVIKSINEDINRKMQEAVNDLDKLN